MATRITEVYADTPEKFGIALKQHRLIRGLSQHDLARKAGVTRKAIISLEKGASGTQLQTVVSVMVALDIPLLRTYVSEEVDE